MYYIPAGMAYIRGTLPDTVNFEHPPLAKYVIGFFALCLNSPNFASLLFGALTTITALALARTLIPEKSWAWTIVWLLTFDQINISISIDPMFDVFALFFALLGMYILLKAKNRVSYAICGGVFGLALASKWVAAFLILPSLVFLLIKRKCIAAAYLF